MSHERIGRANYGYLSNEYGNRLSHLLDKLKVICKRAGMRGHSPKLALLFGAHLRMAGVNLADIADLKGTTIWRRLRFVRRWNNSI